MSASQLSTPERHRENLHEVFFFELKDRNGAERTVRTNARVCNIISEHAKKK
jgi:hypothetical protein